MFLSLSCPLLPSLLLFLKLMSMSLVKDKKILIKKKKHSGMILIGSCWASAKPYLVILQVLTEYLQRARDPEAGTPPRKGCSPAVLLCRPWVPGSVGHNSDKATEGHALFTKVTTLDGTREYSVRDDLCCPTASFYQMGGNRGPEKGLALPKVTEQIKDENSDLWTKRQCSCFCPVLSLYTLQGCPWAGQADGINKEEKIIPWALFLEIMLLLSPLSSFHHLSWLSSGRC